MERRHRLNGWFMISPYLIHQSIFFGFAIGWLGYLMFVKWNFLTDPVWVGFGNFIDLFNDKVFWIVLKNTFNFILYFIPISLTLSILLGMAFNKLKYTRTFVVLAFLLANISSGVGYSIVFQNLLAENGPLNQALYRTLGFVIPWFSRVQLANLAIALMVTWKFIGYFGLIFLSGLSAIPTSIYEAAMLDGAGKFKRFTKITLPLINPSLTMVLVLQIVLCFGIFTEPYLITGGGPRKSTYTFLLYIYDNAFKKFITTGPGYAAAISVVAAVICFLCIFIVRKFIEKEVDMV
jgi:multiple sugar transport system permease protein